MANDLSARVEKLADLVLDITTVLQQQNKEIERMQHEADKFNRLLVQFVKDLAGGDNNLSAN